MFLFFFFAHSHANSAFLSDVSLAVGSDEAAQWAAHSSHCFLALIQTGWFVFSSCWTLTCVRFGPVRKTSTRCRGHSCRFRLDISHILYIHFTYPFGKEPVENISKGSAPFNQKFTSTFEICTFLHEDKSVLAAPQHMTSDLARSEITRLLPSAARRQRKNLNCADNNLPDNTETK